LKSAVAFGVLLLVALGTMFKDLIFSGVVPPDVAGPIGIIHLASRENLLTSGLLSVLNFAGILSINLAIVNMLPFPALDGGRALFIMIEKAIGGRLKPKLEYWANMTGMAILLTLIVLISIRDLNSVFADEAFQNWFQGLLGVVKGG
jgi:regulator of sigma E protease